MSMREAIGIALAAGLLLGPASVFAQQVPDLKGTWKGTNEAVVLGTGRITARTARRSRGQAVRTSR
jgi:hypothetical protein